jgi:hypothetical protein
MTEQFSTDLKAREHLYKHFDIETSQGKIKIQGVSNVRGRDTVELPQIVKIYL